MTGRATTPLVVGALTEADAWCTIEWVAKTTNLRADQVASALDRLIKDGRVLKAGSRSTRSYRLAPAAAQAGVGDTSTAPAEDVVEPAAPFFDVAIWASGAVVIEKDGQQLALDSAEADRLIVILRAAESMRDEFVEIDRAAAAAVAEDKAA